jgi:NADPH-dependent curcumin reductase CurA
MSQRPDCNRRIVLSSRPDGAPTADNFRIETVPVPEVGPGQVLLRAVWLSVDPYMRGRMSEAPSYAPPVRIDEVMVGGTVARVVSSRHDRYQVGDLVLGYGGWQDYALSDGQGLKVLAPNDPHPSHRLGVLGMPGLTGYMGLLDIGHPVAGETVVVAAATGAVGAVVGQVAKIQGCHVVGIAGGPEKCRHAVTLLGFDACLDHRDPALPEHLRTACANGIDVYFESVGGAVFDAVLPLLNTKARIPVCGLVADYNATALPAGPDRLGLLVGVLLRKRIRMQGFIVFDDYGSRWEEFAEAMGAWLTSGKVKAYEDIIQGLENAPQAFIGLLQGKNLGKLVIQLARQ